jgi:arginase
LLQRSRSPPSHREVSLPTRLITIGAPSSAGAYAPGQERAPAALRAAGLLKLISAGGVSLEDAGDVAGFRWRADQANPRAMNADAVFTVARETADRVASALASDATVLVLGGDCTVELGTVAGALRGDQGVGLVYVDLDTDLNTPESTQDGALDWMGVAHLLGIEGTLPKLVGLGPRAPMLRPDQVLLFSAGNVEPFERRVIQKLGIAEVPLGEVLRDPSGCGAAIASGWARRFERLLVHLDVDVLDFGDMPLAENTRRNIGLRFDQLMSALRPLLAAPNLAALTVTEVNPDHGESDGSTLVTFAGGLVDALTG